MITGVLSEAEAGTPSLCVVPSGLGVRALLRPTPSPLRASTCDPSRPVREREGSRDPRMDSSSITFPRSRGLWVAWSATCPLPPQLTRGTRKAHEQTMRWTSEGGGRAARLPSTSLIAPLSSHPFLAAGVATPIASSSFRAEIVVFRGAVIPSSTASSCVDPSRMDVTVASTPAINAGGDFTFMRMPAFRTLPSPDMETDVLNAVPMTLSAVWHTWLAQASGLTNSHSDVWATATQRRYSQPSSVFYAGATTRQGSPSSCALSQPTPSCTLPTNLAIPGVSPVVRSSEGTSTLARVTTATQSSISSGSQSADVRTSSCASNPVLGGACRL
ncbi:hypothetical protein BD310DRAFT_599673 [Dichomitus squalens]|uniref:Uncharacterized protein n=1 Tax=Dichomitus squalens TaxID=114155 RepID=A0A4V2K7P1_9APHY|nr:hypothetical protein BD310DRAFT_599673 [Dichomitus squalens]